MCWSIAAVSTPPNVRVGQRRPTAREGARAWAPAWDRAAARGRRAARPRPAVAARSHAPRRARALRLYSGIVSLYGSYDAIAGYTPATDVAAHAAIDLDVTAIINALDGTDTGYAVRSTCTRTAATGRGGIPPLQGFSKALSGETEWEAGAAYWGRTRTPTRSSWAPSTAPSTLTCTRRTGARAVRADAGARARAPRNLVPMRARTANRWALDRGHCVV